MKKILCMAAACLIGGTIGGTLCAQQPQGASLHLLETAHDFGDVPRKGGDLVWRFPLRNEGRTPLVLTRVITSCSCLRADYSRRPVAPGATDTIRIIYEPHKSEPGVFHKVIQIYSNSAGGREVITVQGNSVDSPKIKLKNDKLKIKN